MDIWTKEDVYDEQIAPLMSKIIAICKEHDIPVVAQFQYANTEEEAALCTTTIVGERGDPSIRKLAALMSPQAPVVLAETITTDADGKKLISIRRISG